MQLSELTVPSKHTPNFITYPDLKHKNEQEKRKSVICAVSFTTNQQNYIKKLSFGVVVCVFVTEETWVSVLLCLSSGICDCRRFMPYVAKKPLHSFSVMLCLCIKIRGAKQGCEIWGTKRVIGVKRGAASLWSNLSSAWLCDWCEKRGQLACDQTWALYDC